VRPVAVSATDDAIGAIASDWQTDEPALAGPTPPAAVGPSGPEPAPSAVPTPPKRKSFFRRLFGG
jgi:hypothetical protein